MSLVNEAEPGVREKLHSWQQKAPALAALRELLEGADAAYRVVSEGEGLEVACDTPLRGRPNRGRMRIVAYDEEKMAVFFFKVSSGDGGQRFSYGGLAFKADRLRPDQIRSWLEFVASGLGWEKRPRGLVRSFQYTLPD
ncbi:MAG: hypothetical protein ACE5ID_07365 [Acidobacteriota bacterium]